MYDMIIVGLIVATAVFFMARSLYRNLTGKTDACSCNTGCPLSGTCQHSTCVYNATRRPGHKF